MSLYLWYTSRSAHLVYIKILLVKFPTDQNMIIIFLIIMIMIIAIIFILMMMMIITFTIIIIIIITIIMIIIIWWRRVPGSPVVAVGVVAATEYYTSKKNGSSLRNFNWMLHRKEKLNHSWALYVTMIFAWIFTEYYSSKINWIIWKLFM